MLPVLAHGTILVLALRYGKVMIEHMTYLAPRHMECRFVWVDAENAPFLTDKLNIWMLPTIICLKDNKVLANIPRATSPRLDSCWLLRLPCGNSPRISTRTDVIHLTVRL